MATLELIEAAKLLRFDPANGWPETFTRHALAALHTWRKGIELKAWNDDAADWRKLVELAIQAGAIEHATTTERIKTRAQGRRIVNPGFASREWVERGFESAQVERRSFLGGTIPTAYTQPAQYADVTHHHITAPAFAAWLAAQGLEPCTHIAAWFKAQGVGSAPAGESRIERNARWLTKFWDTESPTHAKGSQARAIAAIVAAEGVTVATAKRGLQDAENTRKEQYRDSGVRHIKPGKNTAANPFNTVKPKARTTL